MQNSQKAPSRSRGYAQQLATYLDEKNLQAGNIPFYELLGYTKRRIIPATKIKRLVI